MKSDWVGVLDIRKLRHHYDQPYTPILTDFQGWDTLWGFVPPSPPPQGSTPPLPCGDYNLDDFPNALVILRNTTGSVFLVNPSSQKAVFLENIPCSIEAGCTGGGSCVPRSLGPSDLASVPSAVAAGFFDIYEDPFGVNQPGPYIMYSSVDSNGHLKKSSAGHLSQMAHLSLQLPYTVLGLGRSASFLDHLYVGIPHPPGRKEIRKQEWTAIIPNSQLIVIPYPHGDPRSWSAELYLTPSNIALLTAIALIGECIFILVIISILLHW